MSWRKGAPGQPRQGTRTWTCRRRGELGERESARGNQRRYPAVDQPARTTIYHSPAALWRTGLATRACVACITWRGLPPATIPASQLPAVLRRTGSATTTRIARTIPTARPPAGTPAVSHPPLWSPPSAHCWSATLRRLLPAGIAFVGLAGLFRPALVFLRGDIESTQQHFGRQFSALGRTAARIRCIASKAAG